MEVDVFSALSNPIRRDLLGLLRGGAQPVKALAAHFDRGRPAISEHLAVLKKAGLVEEEPRGRERYYHLNAAPLKEVQGWLNAYQAFWGDSMERLSQLLDEEEE